MQKQSRASIRRIIFLFYFGIAGGGGGGVSGGSLRPFEGSFLSIGNKFSLKITKHALE